MAIAFDVDRRVKMNRWKGRREREQAGPVPPGIF
jgi:hypothetical protein